MSGRLTILPKKTYCPWKQENIERVLRDERLERERIEKDSAANAKYKKQLQHGSSRRDGVVRGSGIKRDDEEGNKEKGHINLFPEAKEAELQLANGTSSLSNQQQQQTNNNGIKVDESGVEPIPLGGNESINRKVGNVPFYMRSTTASATTISGSSAGKTSNNEEKYINTNNSFRLGTKRSTNNNYPNNNNTDAITNKLMQDQYIQREDYRKRNMDPMNRFYVDSSSARGSVSGGTGSMEGVYANGSANGRNGINSMVGRNAVNTSSKPKSSVDESMKEKIHKKKKRRRRKKRSYSSDSSSTSSSSVDKDRHKKKKRHKSKKNKRSSHRHRGHRHDKNRDNNKTELQELRRRRHARESNERERLNNNSRGDASSSFDGSTIQTKDTRCYDGSNGFH